MEEDTIDWKKVIGKRCARCGKECGYRQIRSYYRGVIELFPFREDMVPIACFRCKNNKGDFSMLPYQLAPYIRYTIVSMLGVIALIHVLRADQNQSIEACVLTVGLECRLTPYLVRYWLARYILQATYRAYSILQKEPCDTEKAKCVYAEFFTLVCAMGVRDPPCMIQGLLQLAKRYSSQTNHHFLGIPSQERSCKGSGVGA